MDRYLAVGCRGWWYTYGVRPGWDNPSRDHRNHLHSRNAHTVWNADRHTDGDAVTDAVDADAVDTDTNAVDANGDTKAFANINAH